MNGKCGDIPTLTCPQQQCNGNGVGGLLSFNFKCLANSQASCSLFQRPAVLALERYGFLSVILISHYFEWQTTNLFTDVKDCYLQPLRLLKPPSLLRPLRFLKFEAYFSTA